VEFGERQMAPLLWAGARRCFRENLFRLPQNRNAENLVGTPDFLICPGVFDDLPDEPAASPDPGSRSPTHGCFCNRGFVPRGSLSAKTALRTKV
jgi:hypothetical protein